MQTVNLLSVKSFPLKVFIMLGEGDFLIQVTSMYQIPTANIIFYVISL